jgi:DNA-binding NarL/FixJ family response regulator
VRVVLADDTMLLREGVARLLDDAGFDVVGQSANADELLAQVASCSPDVAIVDIRMPPTHTDEGLRAALEIRSGHPRVGVLVLSQHADIGLAMKLLAANAEGVGSSASRTAGPCWTRRSCLSYSATVAATIRSRRSRRAHARCSS